MAQYEIIIRNDTEQSKKSPIAGNDTAPTSTDQEEGFTAKDFRKGVGKGLAIANTYVKPFVDRMVSHKISTVTLRTGAQELEEQMSNEYQIGQKIYGVATSVAMGALIGGLPGALVGGVVSFIASVVDYENRKEKFNLERSRESIGLQFLNARAGGSIASFGGSRSKNR